MGALRLVNVLGISDQLIIIDDGTLSRAASPVPGVTGRDASQPALIMDVELTWDQIQEDMKTHEALITHLYLDSVNKVTVGIGNMLPTLSAAQALGFVVRTDDKAATREQIKADWDAVNAEAGKNWRAKRFVSVTKLDLPEDICWSLLKKRIDDEFIPGLKKIFPDWTLLPTPVKRALLDMAYNLGLTGLKKFKTLITHVKKQDWVKAAKRCKRKGIPTERNEWTEARFEEASATVQPRKP